MNGPSIEPGVAASRAVRTVWAVSGLLLVAFGFVGFVVPVMPSTVFFVGATWCFSRSSRRLERWLLGLPLVGRLVGDYRVGLGMPQSAKLGAVAVMWTAIGVSVVLLWQHRWMPIALAVLGLVGTAVIVWRVPTRERVLAERAARDAADETGLPVRDVPC